MELLRDRGAAPVSVPVMELEPLLSPSEFQTMAEGIARGRWQDVVFTSANAVRLVLPERPALGSGARIFAIGSGTAQAAAQLGWSVEPLPASFIAESLAELLLAAGVTGRRILLPRAEGARQLLPEALAQAGAELEVVAIYRMRPDEASRSRLKAALAAPGLDCIIFTSGSSVECFQALRNGDSLGSQLLVACIGPITARAAARAGLLPGLVAEQHSLPGLVAALERRLGPLPENGRS